ncbi:glutamate/Leucine/Phenylalanine/Valine dehydrogenase [Colletotrichum costaricense]|uniref:Glutamate dehydrogenase n=1 Tax=Colletotrichum costaricense TaxID=1209916 RepID=A0AAI9YLM2_9PEZI|nr:glutamate/Leucine/Phenylalanine/Valine dehydrogenase [Colletotrichum costaricense]KAK1515352.1 glutamate/Leucine/Phenylalanine/Valine dehydrogenase [Colletotrichum costaricense]
MSYEPEFQQAYDDLVSSLEASSLLTEHPEYRRALPIVCEPETIAQFRVVWDDDQGKPQLNRGYRIHYNTALGPCKGGIRFHKSVNLSVLKFLGLAQVFKNALTGLSIGGAKGGSDFDPKGRTDNEIRRFCQAFMNQLHHHVGINIDIPGGDIGVSEREIGWLFGHFKTINRSSEAVITGKGLTWGGSYGRKEAAGFGVAYYVEEMIRYRSKGTDSLKGKAVAVSGAGNVALHAALKTIQLGGIVKSVSDSLGSLVATSARGIDLDTLQAIMVLKTRRAQLATFAKQGEHTGFNYIAGVRPWEFVGQVDVAMPCATQNELSLQEAKSLIAAGCHYVAEGSNMGCTAEACALFES